MYEQSSKIKVKTIKLNDKQLQELNLKYNINQNENNSNPIEVQENPNSNNGNENELNSRPYKIIAVKDSSGVGSDERIDRLEKIKNQFKPLSQKLSSNDSLLEKCFALLTHYNNCLKTFKTNCNCNLSCNQYIIDYLENELKLLKKSKGYVECDEDLTQESDDISNDYSQDMTGHESESSVDEMPPRTESEAKILDKLMERYELRAKYNEYFETELKSSNEEKDITISNDDNERPIVIGKFLNEKHRNFTKSLLLKNKNLIKIKDKTNNNIFLLYATKLRGKDDAMFYDKDIIVGYQCAYNGCEYRSKQRTPVFNHINAKHIKTKPYNCEICNKKLGSREGVLNHKKKVHFRVKSYKCDVTDCEFEGISEYSILVHKSKVHEKPKQYECDFIGCKYVGKKPCELKEHKNRVHDKQNHKFLCDWPECKARFYRDSEKQKHIDVVHKKIKPYLCQWPACDARYESEGHLKTHTRLHTNERPYACNWPDCESKFRSAVTLRMHKLAHEGVKPYSCPWTGCQMKFLRTGDRKRHVMCHKSGRNMKCWCCNRNSSKKSNIHYSDDKPDDDYQQSDDDKQSDDERQTDDEYSEQE